MSQKTQKCSDDFSEKFVVSCNPVAVVTESIKVECKFGLSYRKGGETSGEIEEISKKNWGNLLPRDMILIADSFWKFTKNSLNIQKKVEVFFFYKFSSFHPKW